MNGILLVDKPRGPTSHDIINIVRDRFKIKKAGHAGTLDPLATGLLIVLIGKTTKLSGKFLNSDKEYNVSCLLGLSTDTDDLEGKILKESFDIQVTKDDFRKVLTRFKGKIKQRVPKYSAVKIRGKKLYELARKNKKVELPVKEVEIYDIKMTAFNLPEVSLKIKCSKGTYIRSLIHDIGKELTCGACVSQLRRLKSYPFSEKEAIKLKTIMELTQDELKKYILPIKDNETLQSFIESKKF